LPFIPADKHGSLVLTIVACSVGDRQAGERAVAPLQALALATRVADLPGAMPYPALYEFTEPGTVGGLHHHDRAMYLRSFPDDVASKVMAFMSNATSQIRVLGGEMARVAADHTAFASLDAEEWRIKELMHAAQTRAVQVQLPGC
jgi:hypothetical protein